MTAQALFAPAMVRALELAQNGPERGINPRVGCVLVDSSGTIVADGWHQGSGTPHAEVIALTGLRDKGISAAGLTAVVTLEPCAHTGKTGPCATALIDAGIARVVFSV
ncbi:MAG: riboflavin biosynthesis protein RibD, partial [Pontimonas sp.]